MKKSLKNFVIPAIVAVLCFIASLVIQHFYAVKATINFMVGIAIWSALLGAILVVVMMYVNSNFEKISIDYIILNLLATASIISMVLLLSTLENTICNIFLICFGVSFALSVMWLIYLAIKELIKAYKKYKENQ